MSLLMLDTDMSSYIIRLRPVSLLERFEKHAPELCVSAITAAELRSSADKAGKPKLTDLVEQFLGRLQVLDWSSEVTFHYARIRAALDSVRKPMGNLDLLIAAHAICESAAIVTNNVRLFENVPGLKIEAWK